MLQCKEIAASFCDESFPKCGKQANDFRDTVLWEMAVDTQYCGTLCLPSCLRHADNDW